VKTSCECACGGEIVACSTKPVDIREAVRTHYQTLDHAVYRWIMDAIHRSPPDPTVVPTPVDVSGNTSGASGRAGVAA
jgi:hypothetical protein